MNKSISGLYSIIRFYFDESKKNRIISKNNTLDEARSHCQSEKTHDTTNPDIKKRFFDGFQKQ